MDFNTIKKEEPPGAGLVTVHGLKSAAKERPVMACYSRTSVSIPEFFRSNSL